jgi:16S rRNA (cytosine967-C5)-methyltransferase
MRLGGRLAAAIEVLEDMDRRHRPVADALRDWGLSHRFAGAGDRAAIGNIVYDALRRRRSAGWVMDADTPRAHAIGALLIETGLAPRDLSAMLEGDRFAPQPLDEKEIGADVSRLSAAPGPVRAEAPDWCVPLLERSFGADWIEEGAALASRPPLDLRVNTLASSREKVLSELKGTGALPCRLAPQGLRIAPIEGDGRHPNVQVEPAFQKGWFEVQDEGSQLAALIAGAEPGMQVLDYCAGAGGKTLAMAAAMDNRGQLFAHDADKSRLAPIFDRLRRAGTRNVQAFADAARLEPLVGQCDLVLVDAPCTGSGTWRRRPDAKWRLSERQLEQRRGEQAAILDAAARYVKPGGRLVYVTCSVFEEENSDQVDGFRQRSDGFTFADHGDLWRLAVGDQPLAARITDSGILLSPAKSGTDGFFVSVMQRAQIISG